MASSRVSPATKRRAMRRVVPLEVTHLAKRGLSESLRSVARSMQYDYARVNPLGLVRVPIQELFRIEGGHAAGARGGDGLAVAMILHIARNEYPRYSGQGAMFGNEVAIAVHLQLAFEHGRVGIVADGHEYAVNCDFASFFRLQVAKTSAFDVPFRRKNFFDDERSDEFDFRIGPGAVNHDFGGAKFVAAVSQVDLVCVARQKVSLF